MPSWKLSASNIGWKKEDDEAVWAYMHKLGYQGLEIAPTRVFAQQPYAQLSGAALFAGVMYQKYGFVIPSMQSIWFGRSESLYEPGGAQALFDYTCEAFEFARACHCPSLVFGCPRNRNVPEGHTAGEMDDFFTELGQEASLRGVRLALEPNPPLYNTNFLNTTAQTAEYLRRLANPGLALNLDMGTIIENKEKIRELTGILSQVSHIHISRPGLAPLKPDQRDRELALLLGAVGYRGFVSVEMKTSDLDTVKNSLAYAAEVFG